MWNYDCEMWSNAHELFPWKQFPFLFFYFFCRSIYNLSNFAWLFLKYLSATLKTRTKQWKVTLLQLEIISCLISIAKTQQRTLGLLLMLCLYNTIDTMTRGFIFPVKNVCELTLITQSWFKQTKSKNNRCIVRYPNHLFFCRLWF